MEIQAKELRLGNLITYKSEVIKVTGVGEYGIQSKEGNRILDAKFRTSDLESIPLTEEWLVKFGFVEYYKDGRYAINGFIIYSDGKGGNFHISLADNKVVRLPYVHILQNAFALTGEELTMKEQ